MAAPRTPTRPAGEAQYLIPKSYTSDKLTNNEVGWKTEWLDHRLQWNGAIYQENWNDVQVAFFDPGVVGNIFFNANGQDFRIRGIETSFVGRVTTGLTLQGGVAWNQSEQTNSPMLLNNNPQSANYGQPITTACNAFGANCVTGNPYLNPFGPSGSPSANSPPMQFAVRARYEWNVSNYRPYVQLGATHSDHSYTQAGSNPALRAGNHHDGPFAL